MADTRSSLDQSQSGPRNDGLVDSVLFPEESLGLELASAYQGVGSSAGKFATTYALGAAFRDRWDGFPATIEVIDTETNAVVQRFDQFLLTGENEAQSERADPVYTFATTSVFTSGRQPRIYVYQGVLLLTQKDGNTRNALSEFYQKYWRASACLVGEERRRAPYHARMSFRGIYRHGFVISFDTTVVAEIPTVANVAFSMFVFDEYDG